MQVARALPPDSQRPTLHTFGIAMHIQFIAGIHTPSEIRQQSRLARAICKLATASMSFARRVTDGTGPGAVLSKNTIKGEIDGR